MSSSSKVFFHVKMEVKGIGSIGEGGRDPSQAGGVKTDLQRSLNSSILTMLLGD